MRRSCVVRLRFASPGDHCPVAVDVCGLVRLVAHLSCGRLRGRVEPGGGGAVRRDDVAE
jgi:hypothetical protein